MPVVYYTVVKRTTKTSKWVNLLLLTTMYTITEVPIIFTIFKLNIFFLTFTIYGSNKPYQGARFYIHTQSHVYITDHKVVVIVLCCRNTVGARLCVCEARIWVWLMNNNLSFSHIWNMFNNSNVYIVYYV